MRLDPCDEVSEDIQFDPPAKGDRWTERCGTTRQMEAPEDEESGGSGLEQVCVLWTHVPEEITLEAEATKSVYKFIMTSDGDVLVAEQEMRDGTWWY